MSKDLLGGSVGKIKSSSNCVPQSSPLRMFPHETVAPETIPPAIVVVIPFSLLKVMCEFCNSTTTPT